MAPEKTEALLVTDRRSFQYPRIVLGENEVQWKTSIKYLGVQLDRRLSFGEHLQIAAAKVIECEANLARLMPNIGGPREAKRRLVASVVHSKLLYAAPVWTNALQNHAIQNKLFSAQRLVALRIVSAYRTISTNAVLVLASVPPINLLADIIVQCSEIVVVSHKCSEKISLSTNILYLFFYLCIYNIFNQLFNLLLFYLSALYYFILKFIFRKIMNLIF